MNSQKQMANVIVVVCTLLSGLCGDIIALVKLFAKLNSLIKQLVAEHTDARNTVEDLRDDLEDSKDDEGGPRMNDLDYDTFLNQLHENDTTSAEIHTMTTLYAEIISDVINPGISKVVEASWDDGSESNASMIAYDKQRGMDDYLSNARQTCNAREQQADAKLKKLLAEIDEAHGRSQEKRQSQNKRRVQREKGNLGRHSSSGFFSRIFS